MLPFICHDLPANYNRDMWITNGEITNPRRAHLSGPAVSSSESDLQGASGIRRFKSERIQFISSLDRPPIVESQARPSRPRDLDPKVII